MELWIFVSVAAALFQAVRFMLQKVLASAALTATGATFARFAYSAPLVSAGLLVWMLATGTAWPSVAAPFWGFAVAGGLAQILATLCVVALFKHRHFAVGLTFAKTEVILTALIGLVVLGDRVAPWAMAAILTGVLGVIVLSRRPGSDLHWSRDLFGRATALGVGSGLLFAVSAVSYRGAALSVMAEPAALRAAVTLAAVTAFQAAAMLTWLAWRDRAEIRAVWHARRTASVMGLASLGGSFCWFWAFALQNAALVKAVGQVELIVAAGLGAVVFKERVTRRETLGIALLGASILGIVLS